METELINIQNSDTIQPPQSALFIDNSTPERFQGLQSEKQGTYDKLNQLFSEKDYQQKIILETREMLGESAKDLTDSQVYDLTNEIQFLVDSWLEEFERKTFDGKTLNELLGFVLK